MFEDIQFCGNCSLKVKSVLRRPRTLYLVPGGENSKLAAHLMKSALDTVHRLDNPLVISVRPFPATHITQVSEEPLHRSDDGARNPRRDSLSRVPGGDAERRASLKEASAQVAPGRRGSMFEDMQVI